MSDISPLLSVKNIAKSFGPKKVLEDISFTLDKGESLVIIGGSGSGKSVLIKTLMGLIPLDRGNIYFRGEEIHLKNTKDREALMKECGMLFQGGALFDSLPVWENVTFGLLQRKKIKRNEARDLAIEKLASVGLKSETADLFPAELSGGMQKRVALARAIATNPPLVFFDEPTAGLDPIMADVIDQLMTRCSKEWGAATITISHDMASVRKVADQVAMLYQGKFIWKDNVSKLDNSDNPYVSQFVQGKSDGPIEIAVK